MIRAALALLFFLACVACVTPKADPRIEQMQAELEAMKAKPAEPAPKPKPTIQQTVVQIAGVKLPPKCAVIERSDIQVQGTTYAALLWCAEKPPGVTPVVVPAKKTEQKK